MKFDILFSIPILINIRMISHTLFSSFTPIFIVAHFIDFVDGKFIKLFTRKIDTLQQFPFRFPTEILFLTILRNRLNNALILVCHLICFITDIFPTNIAVSINDLNYDNHLF